MASVFKQTRYGDLTHSPLVVIAVLAVATYHYHNHLRKTLICIPEPVCKLHSLTHDVNLMLVSLLSDLVPYTPESEPPSPVQDLHIMQPFNLCDPSSFSLSPGFGIFLFTSIRRGLGELELELLCKANWHYCRMMVTLK